MKSMVKHMKTMVKHTNTMVKHEMSYQEDMGYINDGMKTFVPIHRPS